MAVPQRFRVEDRAVYTSASLHQRVGTGRGTTRRSPRSRCPRSQTDSANSVTARSQAHAAIIPNGQATT